MRKRELIAAIADETCIPRAEVEVTLEAFFKIVKKTVNNGETMNIQSIAIFPINKRLQKKQIV
ncbi:HU family DNA-binding protein [Pedobacter sp.]